VNVNVKRNNIKVFAYTYG